MSKRRKKIESKVTATYNIQVTASDNILVTASDNKVEKVLGIVGSVITIITFLGISSISYMEKLITKYNEFIPVLVGVLGVSNYYLTLGFVGLSRKFILAGIRGGGGEVKEKEVEHNGNKYATLLLLVGLFIVEIGTINPIITSIDNIGYAIWIFYVLQYISIASVGILDTLFCYCYLFKGYTWGKCIGKYLTPILILFGAWGISFILLLVLQI